jgi:hypothetical protein
MNSASATPSSSSSANPEPPSLDFLQKKWNLNAKWCSLSLLYAISTCLALSCHVMSSCHVFRSLALSCVIWLLCYLAGLISSCRSSISMRYEEQMQLWALAGYQVRAFQPLPSLSCLSLLSLCLNLWTCICMFIQLGFILALPLSCVCVCV